MDRSVPPRKASTAICHNSITSAIANAAIIAVIRKLPKNVTRARLTLSKRSAIRPPTGDTKRKGSIEAKVMIPIQLEESDLLSINQELATMNVHMAAPENILAAHV